MTEMIYVHIDTVSNAVLTQGIATKDFYQGIVHQPKNLLLLNPSSDLGEFETHTAMRIIRGSEAVENYFQLVSKERAAEDNKWIDFSELAMLKELTPLEISELLYFGHMKTHLHSPFFYKLQNNFVYFDLKDTTVRTYYRYLDEFYRILANKLTYMSLEALNDKRSFFRKPKPVERINIELMKSLRDVMREGIIFSLEQATSLDGLYKIPLFIVGDPRFRISVENLSNEDLVGYLTYDIATKKWHTDIDRDRLTFATLTNTFH